MKALVVFGLMIFGLSNVFAQEGRQSANAVWVIFSSVGTGIDSESSELVAATIEAGVADGTVSKHFLRRWGREGEITYCVVLTAPTYRHQFVKDIAPSILQGQVVNGWKRTSVKVGINCADETLATEQDLSKY